MWSSKRVGVLSMSLSVVAAAMHGAMLIFYQLGTYFPVIVAFQIVAIFCSILAASRGSKLWLLASVWPAVYLVAVFYALSHL